MDVLACGVPIEFNSAGKVNFGNDRGIGTVENCRVFQRLVLPFGYGEQDETEVFAEIV